MHKHEAERLEAALQGGRIEHDPKGQVASLLRTAQQARALGGPVPAPPHGLAPGRARLLAEAARMRARKTAPQRAMSGALRAATVLATLLLVLGLGWGAVAAAGDLPGEPFYGLKLAAETLRLALPAAPQSQAALHRQLAAERLDEIVEMLERGRPVGEPVLERAQVQLSLALQAAAGLDDAAAMQAFRQLALSLQEQEQAMVRAAGEEAPVRLRSLLREMERVRQEAHLGEGDPSGLRQRLRQGTPPEPPAGSATPSHTVTPGARPSDTPAPTGRPSRTPGPKPGHTTSPTAGPSQTPTNRPPTAPLGTSTSQSTAAPPEATPQGTAAPPEATPQGTAAPPEATPQGTAAPPEATPQGTAAPPHTPSPGPTRGQGGGGKP